MSRLDRRRWIVLVATLLGIALTASLGRWQLRRAAQKVALQRTLDVNAALPPLTADALPVATSLRATPPRAGVAGIERPEDDPTAAAVGRRIHLRGRWDAAHAVYLENRQMAARVGFFLVMPLRLEGRPDAILVQRGWLPRDIRDRTLLPPVETPGGLVEVDGRIAAPPARLFEFAPSTAGTIRQNLDLGPFAAETGSALQPVSVQQSEAPDRPSDGLGRHWPAPAVDVQKHYGYAAQWFAMSALMAILHVWFQYLRPRFVRLRGA